jgi:hypothetical protein
VAEACDRQDGRILKTGSLEAIDNKVNQSSGMVGQKWASSEIPGLMCGLGASSTSISSSPHMSDAGAVPSTAAVSRRNRRSMLCPSLSMELRTTTTGLAGDGEAITPHACYADKAVAPGTLLDTAVSCVSARRRHPESRHGSSHDPTLR